MSNNLFKRGEKVLVAASGGPDSMCLLHILYSLRTELDITLGVAHINHMLRGEEANKDEEYVRQFCNDLSIPFYVKRVDINKVASSKSISSEMAGREERYEFFEKIMKEYKFSKTAIAHNANDQAETLLMRIMRGTGIEGLVGIKPMRDGCYVRPILCLTREEIELYCDENQLHPRIDKTNFENIYSRNKVRLEMLPYIRKNFNSDIIGALNRLSTLASRDVDYIEKKVEEAKSKFFIRDEMNKLIIRKDAFTLHESILTRLIRRALTEVTGSNYNFEMKNINDIILLQNGETGKKISLPNRVEGENIYGDIRLFIGEVALEKKKIEYNLSDAYRELEKYNEVCYHLKDFNYDVEMKIIENRKVNFDKSDLVKYFDYDNIRGDMVIRNRKSGDKIVPLGMNGSKKIKNMFIDEKIPQDRRDFVPIVCFGDEIAWIVGIKVSDIFKVTRNTNKILQIKFIERIK